MNTQLGWFISANFKKCRLPAILGVSLATVSFVATPTVVWAQDEEKAIEEVVVTAGPRATIQKSIELKRNSTQIVDGLNAEEIGEIPALSIGEALESLTGVASHRENGGATEQSIRGLGPFLTSTVLNGRSATSGNGTRGVNFSIFPSELFNKIGVHKTQSASHIEGAVGGQIQLETRKPLEYGKRRFQFGLKGAFNEYQQDVRGGDEFGYRATASYIDQFDTEELGAFGISVGFQIREESDPEQEFTRSNTPRICDLDNGQPILDPVKDAAICQDDQRDLRDPATTDREFAFLSSAAQFRQNLADDERNAFFSAFQWQPNERLDLNLDVQWSERIQTEKRSDLLFAELNRNLSAPTTVVSNGILQSFQNASQEIQLIGQDFVRDEEYQGVGFNVEYLVNEDLTISFDASYSDTYRLETEESMRFGNNADQLVSADFSQSDVGIFNVANFDVSDLGNFLTGAQPNGVGSVAADFSTVNHSRLRARVQEDIRENTLTAFRGDFDWQTFDLGFVTSIEGGVRFSEMEFTRKGNINSDFNIEADQMFGDPFPQAELLAALANNCVGAPLDNNFEEVSAQQNGQFLNYNAIDAGCSLNLIRTALDSGSFEDSAGNPLTSNTLSPNNTFNGSSVDVEETTYAAYLKFNYDTELFGFPARGDFGLRVVHTEVDSTTYKLPFLLDVSTSDESFELDSPTNLNAPALVNFLDGRQFISANTDTHSYTNYLPSASLVVDLTDDVLFRAGLFRGISRSDPAILGSRQQLGTTEEPVADLAGTGVTAEEIASFITVQGQAGGAADLDAFTSWNVDLALEWYPDADTILAAGVYYKRFKGGYQNTFINDTFTIIGDGSSGTNGSLETPTPATGLFPVDGRLEITAPISSIETTNENSNLHGIELSASHSLSYLDGFLGGFGGTLGYNYAESDFDFEDDFAGAGVGLDDAGNPVQLVGLVPPADIFGLSRHVLSAKAYWGNHLFDASVIYKYRSAYFQQFVETPGRIRYTDDNAVVEFKANYKATDNIKITFEALNLTNEPRIDYRGIDGNIANVLSYGPRFFLGVKGKFH